MTDKDQLANDAKSPDGSADDDEIRRRLVSRTAIAGVLIVALLGGLAVVDALYTSSPESAPKLASQSPQPISQETPHAESAQEEPPADSAALEPSEAPSDTNKGAQEVQENSAAPTPSAHPVPQMDELKPLTKPAEAKPAMLKPAVPLASQPRQQPMHELGHKPVPSAPVAATRHAPASRPLSQAQEPPRRFVVQMGVFNNLANAEELRAKLELNGIPAQIEARVQVGPFSSRQEADEARRKLAALGIDPGLLMAIRK